MNNVGIPVNQLILLSKSFMAPKINISLQIILCCLADVQILDRASHVLNAFSHAPKIKTLDQAKLSSRIMGVHRDPIERTETGRDFGSCAPSQLFFTGF